MPNQKLAVRLSDAELAERAKTYKAPEPKIKTGYLAKYARMATSANTGGVLKWD
jgi:dihydroxy-acid dehydratase